MEKSAILQLFLKKGTQVDHTTLNILADDPRLLEYLLRLDKDKLPSVITSGVLKTLYLNNVEERTTQKISVEQLSQILTERYEFLQNLLTSRQELKNLISINKINEKIKQFSVIGLVSEINGSLILEDSTGQSSFEVSKELAKFIVEDEVIGLVCERVLNQNKVKDIIYPDISFKKESKQTGSLEKCFFISDIQMDSPTFNKNYYENFLKWVGDEKDLKIFILGGVSSKNKDIEKFSLDLKQYSANSFYEKEIKANPILTGIQNTQILLSHGTYFQHYMKLWGTSIETTIVNLVKKRNLNPILTPTTYNNSFLLKTTPDIIAVAGTNHPTQVNYKGTTIITTGSFDTKPIYWLINLQTRETFKIDFS